MANALSSRLASLSTGAKIGLGALGGAALIGGAAGILSARKKKGKSSRRRTRKRSTVHKKKRRYYPRTAGKRKDRSTRRIRFTRTGQPYVILRSGKARFIKKKSAKSSRRRRGGRY